MIDPRIKIRHLQCFLEVARLGHVGRAADQLAITQPAVSKTLRELEDILAARLFDRGRRGVVLTGMGELFRHFAATAVVALEQAVDSVAQGRMRGDTVVRAGALPTVAARLMPAAVQAFAATRLGATVSLLAGPNRFLLDRLKGRDLDLVVGRLADAEQMIGLAFEQLYAERLALVVRPGHPLLARPGFALKDIGAHVVLLPTKEDIIRPTVERLLLANGIGALERRIETVSGDFGRMFLKQSDAVWFISHGVVALDLAAGQLVELPADMSDTKGPVGMTIRAGERPSPATIALMQAIRAAAAQVREADAGPHATG
jgi:LysR family pca operon transcriptional activator